MSKRNKHHKPKGPKSPPQNVGGSEKPANEPPVEVQPQSETVVSEIKPSVPQAEVKPETTPSKEVELKKNTDQVQAVVVEPKSSEVLDSPVKPKRHRNRKNKHKDSQASDDENNKTNKEDIVKESSEVETSVKSDETKKAVEKPPVIESKSESSDHKDVEPKKSGRNKKKDKKDGQHSFEEGTDFPVLSATQLTDEGNKLKSEEKCNKKDAHTQVKGGKQKEEGKKENQEQGKTTEPKKETPTEIKSVEDETPKLGEITLEKDQSETKPERNKRGKNKKNQQGSKPDEQNIPVHEKECEKTTTIESIKKPIVDVKSTKTDECKIEEKQKKSKQEVKCEKGVKVEGVIQESDNATSSQVIEKKEATLETVEKGEHQTEQSKKESKQEVEKPKDDTKKEIDTKKQENVQNIQLLPQHPISEVKRCDSPKNKKSKGKQQQSKESKVIEKEQSEDKCKIVFLSDIIGEKTPKPETSKIEVIAESDLSTNQPSVKEDIKTLEKDVLKCEKVEAKSENKCEIDKNIADQDKTNTKKETTEKKVQDVDSKDKLSTETLQIKKQRKSRSKTPEVKVIQEDVTGNQGHKDEIKGQEKHSKKQNNKKNVEPKKQESTVLPEVTDKNKEIVLKQQSVSEIEKLKESSLEDKKIKTEKKIESPDVKTVPQIEEAACQISKPIENIALSPVIQAPIVESKKTMDCIRPQSKKHRKSRSKTPDVKAEKTESQKTQQDDILPSIATSIEESLKQLVSDCEKIVVVGQPELTEPKIKDNQSKENLKLFETKPIFCPFIQTEKIADYTEKSEAKSDIEKHQEKQKKNKKQGKNADVGDKKVVDTISTQESQKGSEVEIQEPEHKEIKKDTDQFVIQHPLTDDIISALLSDVPPEFIDADTKDQNILVDLKLETKGSEIIKEKEEIAQTSSIQIGSFLTSQVNPNEKSLSQTHEKPTECANDKQGKGGKNKKRDKKSSESEGRKTPQSEVSQQTISETKEESHTEEIKLVETENKAQVEIKDEAIVESEPKPAKRNKDKKQKNNDQSKDGKEPIETSIVSEIVEKIIAEEKSEKAPFSGIEPTSPEVRDESDKCAAQCKPECEKKVCDTCPKKKKGKGKSSQQTLEQELAEACQVVVTQPKKEENIEILSSIAEKVASSSIKEIEPAPTSIDSLKSSDDAKVPGPQDAQSKEKIKRGSKSPAKQSKNLHGPSSSPAKSSKCDYKKEKNKGDKKCPPDLIDKPADIDQKTDASKTVIGHTSGCQGKTDKKEKEKKTDRVDAGAVSIENIEDFEEEFVYKYSFRTVFIANACHICKIQLKSDRVVCRFCHLVCYCTEGHRDDDWASHQSLCYAICTLSHVKAQDHIYADAKSLSGQDYRLLRMQGIVSCEKILKRKLCPWEQEVLLYPRMCLESSCREWRSDKLKDCDGCGQVSYCTANQTHLPMDHALWCASYRLYHRLVSHQLHQGRIEPTLPSMICQQNFQLPDDSSILYKTLYGGQEQTEECYHATLTQLSTAPLTALYAYQRSIVSGVQEGQPAPSQEKKSLCIHIIGAELQFEADTLNKWECFFLHMSADVQDLRIVFIGPELNTSKLPVDLLSKIKMCQSCKQNNRAVRFEFHDTMLYHDFVESVKFSKPDLICAFNPGFHRVTGYAGLDTWPETIAASLRLRVPLCITAYTQYEMPRDLARVQTVCPGVQIKVGPIKNPYASLRPDRNFISDDEMPLIFKNYQLAVVSL